MTETTSGPTEAEIAAAQETMRLAAEAEAQRLAAEAEERRIALLPITELVHSPAYQEVTAKIDEMMGIALPYREIFPHMNALSTILPRLQAAAPAPSDPPT